MQHFSQLAIDQSSTLLCKRNENEFRALLSSKDGQTFDQFFVAFARTLKEISATIRQVKQTFARLIEKIVSSNFQNQ